MGYNLLINGVYWGYNPLPNHLLTSWDIQVGDFFCLFLKGNPGVGESIFIKLLFVSLATIASHLEFTRTLSSYLLYIYIYLYTLGVQRPYNARAFPKRTHDFQEGFRMNTSRQLVFQWSLTYNRVYAQICIYIYIADSIYIYIHTYIYISIYHICVYHKCIWNNDFDFIIAVCNRELARTKKTTISPHCRPHISTSQFHTKTIWRIAPQRAAKKRGFQLLSLT